MTSDIEFKTLPATMPIDGGVLEIEPSIDFSIPIGTTVPTTTAIKTLHRLTDNEIFLNNRLLKLEKELEEIKKANEPRIIVLQEISREEAKKRIVRLINGLDKNEQIYPDEIADKLSIDFQIVMDVLAELEKNGKVEVINSR